MDRDKKVGLHTIQTLMSDVRDILANELASNGTTSDVKQTKKRKRKPKNVSREVFSLLGNAVPSLVPAAATRKRNKKKGSGKWKWTSFTNASSRKKSDLTLNHWVRADIEYPEYPFAKFNVKMNPIPTYVVLASSNVTLTNLHKYTHIHRYSDDEYESIVKPLHLSKKWSRDDTDKLFSLASKYELRWPVIFDRFSVSYDDAVARKSVSNARTLPDLKQRFYDC